MPDREKVIGHLNDCMEASRRDNTWVFVRKDIVEDAIVLLKEQESLQDHYDSLVIAYNDMRKEQEAVEPILKRKGKSKMYNDYVCPVCDNEVAYEQCYCSECGKPFLWEGR